MLMSANKRLPNLQLWWQISWPKCFHLPWCFTFYRNQNGCILECLLLVISQGGNLCYKLIIPTNVVSNTDWTIWLLSWDLMIFPITKNKNVFFSLQIAEDSAKCRSCGAKMSAYFCGICKHFTSIDKNPYHCDKCGICR